MVQPIGAEHDLHSFANCDTVFSSAGISLAVTIVFAALAPFLPLSEIYQCVSNNVGLGFNPLDRVLSPKRPEVSK
jgi:hypothetical protein